MAETQEQFDKRVQAEDRPVEPTNSPLDYAQMAWGAPALAKAVAKYGGKVLGRGIAQALTKETAPLADTAPLSIPPNKWMPGKVLTPSREPFVNVAALTPEEAAIKMGPEGKTLKDIRFATPEDWKAMAQKRLAEQTNPGIRPQVDLRVAQTGAQAMPAPRTHVDDVLDWLKDMAGLPKAAAAPTATATMNRPASAGAIPSQWDPAATNLGALHVASTEEPAGTHYTSQWDNGPVEHGYDLKKGISLNAPKRQEPTATISNVEILPEKK